MSTCHTARKPSINTSIAIHKPYYTVNKFFRQPLDCTTKRLLRGKGINTEFNGIVLSLSVFKNLIKKDFLLFIPSLRNKTSNNHWNIRKKKKCRTLNLINLQFSRIC